MKILYIGTGGIGIPTLEYLFANHEVCGVVTQPDKPVGRKQELLPTPIKTVALAHAAPIFQPVKIRDPEALTPLRALAPEVIVVMAYGQILPEALLAIPSIACVNLHASLLPRHRGAAPIQAAIEAGDHETGITIMHVTKALDAGDIVLKKAIPIRRRETADSLHDRLAALGPLAISEALAQFSAGVANRAPQDSREVTYAAKLDRESGKIDWHFANDEIERKIRAMNPWPGAYTLLPAANDNPPKKLKIYSAIQIRKVSGAAGEVLETGKRGILVGCGKGSLLLRNVQLEGKRRMSAAQFLTGHPLPNGLQLL